MQSGYGVSEIQQFMADTSVHSTLFSISSATPATNPSAGGGGGDAQEIHHSATSSANSHKLINPFHHHQHHHHAHKPPPSPAAMEFSHFHSIPITQQLFTRLPHPHHHQFQLFQNNPAAHYDHHRRLLDHDPVPENHSATGGTMPSFLAANMNFKLAVDDSSGSGSKDGLNNDNNNNIAGGILHGDDASESRLRPWHREEDCSIKEPFWRPLDLDCINRNNKRCKEKESDEPHFAKLISREAAGTGAGGLDNSHQPASGSNYKLFSELEAIYRPGSSNLFTSGCGAYNKTTNNAANQTTGSGSALTGDDHPLMPTSGAPESRADENNSTGGEAHQNVKKTHQHSRRRRQRKKAQMDSIAAFFETLVKQLMDHQELLHSKFIDAMERRDVERAAREDALREQEASRAMREAAARAHDRALAAARESAVISFLEKITGETITLPSLPQQLANIPAAAGEEKLKSRALATAMMKTTRWPKAEVHTLIAVRSGLEGRFQEPGLKGPLWEEVSSAMAAVGYHRSAKRCKEKWENINKYFRKAKYSGRKRSQHSKTCPYFQQLDQLYSNPLPLPQSASPAIKSSDLLDALVVAGADFTDGEEAGESDLSRTQAEDEDPPPPLPTTTAKNQNHPCSFNDGMQ
ncbi:Trihelix transcription factor GT-2 [Platanthera guangdongensis]|uniref:Trihelix transcription factor GT-2 n=1 Tax=Platanthera guangdongensis TaxID=2320717 RepID=A0ABR2MNP9_9ASPA